MRGMLIFIAAAAALVIFLYFLGRRPQPAAASASAGPPSSAPPVPNNGTPSPPPRRAEAAEVVVNHKSTVNEFAQRARVRLIGYEQSGKTAVIRVQWSSDNMAQGADILDVMLKEGFIRDFDEAPPGFRRERTPDGRPVLSTSFKLYFR